MLSTIVRQLAANVSFIWLGNKMKDSIEQIYKDMRLSPIEYLVKQNIHLSLPTDNGYTDSDFYLFRNIMKRNIEERIKNLLVK